MKLKLFASVFALALTLVTISQSASASVPVGSQGSNGSGCHAAVFPFCEGPELVCMICKFRTNGTTPEQKKNEL